MSGTAADSERAAAPIDLEMHLGGGSFVDAMKVLIGDDAGTTNRRQPTAEEIAAREAREETKAPRGG